ncbi:MAG: metallophosphoesterase [Clostridia bacterium]|nr:metallophosphoesterase [Clostridia bacterium]
MIYFTGDTHGEEGRFSPEAMPGEYEFTEKDVLIVAGDFGYLFKGDATERIFLRYLEEKPYTIAFVDGNHENFPLIYSYSRETLWGGKIHRIGRNIVHLCRGQVYDIDGVKIFTMGGAYSIDRYMRTKGYSYWEEELPSHKEYREASENLDRVNMKVDVIVTHTAPRTLIYEMGFTPDPHDAELTGFLDWIMHEVDYSHWFFGHFHIERDFDEKHHALFYSVRSIEGNV